LGDCDAQIDLPGTFNASITLVEELEGISDGELQGAKVEKLLKLYNDANYNVAVLCNHSKAVSKTFGTQMDKMKAKVEEIEAQVKEVEGEMKGGSKDEKDRLKKKKEALVARKEKLEIQMQIKVSGGGGGGGGKLGGENWGGLAHPRAGL
jgi:DNA topoisomerase I